MKKLISIFVAALLLCTFVAGCDTTPVETEPVTQPQTTEAPAETTVATEPEASWQGSEEAVELAEEYYNLLDDGWYIPEAEDLEKTAWKWEGEIETNRYGSYYLMFNTETVDIRWNDGIDENDHVYKGADLTLTVVEGFAVLELDFHEMAGTLYFDILMNAEGTELFFMPDVSTGDVVNATDALCPRMTNCTAPDPMELVGKWDRYKTEVEGYEAETPSGQVTIEITGDSVEQLRISYTDIVRSEWNYTDKALEIAYGAVHYNCGNDVWLANIDHIGRNETTYALTVLGDGTLLLQNFFYIDGAPTVSYEYFKPANQ